MIDDVSTTAVSESADHNSHQAFVGHLGTSGPPPVQGSSTDGGSGDPTYAQPVLLRSLNNVVHPPATTEKTIYDDIQRFQNQQVTRFTHLFEIAIMSRSAILWWYPAVILWQSMHMHAGPAVCLTPIRVHF